MEHVVLARHGVLEVGPIQEVAGEQCHVGHAEGRLATAEAIERRDRMAEPCKLVDQMGPQEPIRANDKTPGHNSPVCVAMNGSTSSEARCPTRAK